MDLNVYREIDRVLLGLSRRIEILRYLVAINYKEEKKKFLVEKVKNPDFVYDTPRYNADKLVSILCDLDLPNDVIGKLFKEKVDELRCKNELLQNLGNKKVVIGKSKELYGKPSKKLIKRAERLLKSLDKQKNLKSSESEIFSAAKLAAKIRYYLRELGINKWKVMTIDQQSVSVVSMQRRIKVSKYKKYSKLAVRRLKVHEIDAHVFRAENGYMQPMRLFVSGLPGYLSTEEGIAAYLEEKSNVESLQSKRRFALRVIAVNLVYEGADFRECFKKIKSYEKDDERCWEITYRVFRGGGFLKDHVYLQGYYQIKKFIDDGGKLEDLYIGKIGLQHLELCKELVAEGVLEQPKYLPEILKL